VNDRFRYRIATLLLCAMLLVLAPLAGQQEPRPATRDVPLAGLQKPVEIFRDRWGVPHIFAQTQEDLFFAQGYMVAHDRMFQLELWMRKAMGRLAEILGPEAVERDRIARLLRYRGDWEAEWRSYSPDTRRIAEAFVRGINAWIEQAGENLPPEFGLLGIRPTPWHPEVVVSRMAAYPMTGNADRELLRAEVVRALGPERAAQLFPTDPRRTPRPEAGLELEGLDERIIAALERAAGEVSFDGDARLVLERRSDDPFGLRALIEGSNNWAISGRRTRTGKPILANDPHRALLLPSLRYIVHLVGPGWNVIGAGEPALPGISIGHNERIAFGLTIFAADQQDIIIERTRADDPQQYFDPAGGGRWRRMEVVEEEIRVKGESAPRKVQLKYTRNGPVIFEEPARQRAYALRWVGSEPGTAGYLGGLAISRAKNWDEFRRALRSWKLPPENFVYADVEGNIGYQAAALVPRRRCDGLLPARGDASACEWEGWLTLDDLPHELNPARQFVATANHKTLPEGEKRLIGFEWSAPFRYRRIEEVLQAAREHDVEASQRLQADVLSRAAVEMRPVMERLPQQHCEDRSRASLPCAVAELRGWDGRMEKDSVAAAIFAAWLARLREAVYRPRVPAEAWRATSRLISLPELIRILREADPQIFTGAEPAAARDRLLGEALQSALGELERRLGGEMRGWRWGALHRATFAHPLAANFEAARAFSRGPVEKPGDGTTVNAAGGANFRHTSGASFRQVIDLADWDRSSATNVPGQSGDPRSPFYDNLLELWAREEHFPLLYSRAAIELHSRERWRLQPRQ
jgi:penicillin amidase